MKDADHHHLPPLEAVGRGQEPSSRETEIAWDREHLCPDSGNRWLAIDDDNSSWPVHATNHLAHCSRDLGNPVLQKTMRDALARFDPRRFLEV